MIASHRCFLATSSLVALALLACSGESKHSDDDDTGPNDAGAGKAGMAGTAGKPGQMISCPDPSDPIDPTATIDDMEDKDAFVTEVAGRNGGWWTAGDETAGASMVPMQTELTDELAPPEPLAEPRCGSHYAMHVTGQGFTDWGAVLGMGFAFGTRADGELGSIPYDASAYTGVEFYARIGDTSVAEVRYQVSDSNTDPDGGLCSVERGSRDECYDSFGVSLPQLDTTWHHYKLPFAGLSQRDYGYTADAVVTTAVYDLTFNFPASSVFDFWVDDLKFY